MKKRLDRVPVPTPESLGYAALSYLGRYAASEGALRRALQNRLRRAALIHPAFARDAALQKILRDVIETIIGKYKKSGVLNDAAYAATKASNLRREGRSRRYIQQALGQKGVRSALTEDALKAVDEDNAGPVEAEIKAARVFARRRKLGIFRLGKADKTRRRKDLAALARAGFSFDTARKALAAALDDEDI
jgi:regulatory protein